MLLVTLIVSSSHSKCNTNSDNSCLPVRYHYALRPAVRGGPKVVPPEALTRSSDYISRT